jgi:hypothetical protein
MVLGHNAEILPMAKQLLAAGRRPSVWGSWGVDGLSRIFGMMERTEAAYTLHFKSSIRNAKEIMFSLNGFVSRARGGDVVEKIAKDVVEGAAGSWQAGNYTNKELATILSYGPALRKTTFEIGGQTFQAKNAADFWEKLQGINEIGTTVH